MSHDILAEVRRNVEGPVVTAVDQVPRGHVRLETCFSYPDGSAIDLFLAENADQPLFCRWNLTDFGQTMSWLLTAQVRPWQSKKRTAFIDDVVRALGAKLDGGAISMPVKTLADLPHAVVKLGQACLRVSDLLYTRRQSLQSAFADEVEELVSDTSLPYEADIELLGRYGPIRVDFLVTGLHAVSAILTLSSTSPSLAHQAANEVFRRWYDLSIPERSEQRLTLLDDRQQTYKDDDLHRLAALSTVLPFSDRRAVADALAA